jgi:hypothetical protein
MSEKCQQARSQTETLKAKKPRTMLSRMLLLALNDHNEAVYLSKLDRWEKPGGELCNNVRRSSISALVPLARTFCSPDLLCQWSR